MKVKVGKHIVELYSSADTLPILRFNQFTKNIMLDNDVGSSLPDYDKRLSKAISFLQSDLKDEAIKELENNRQNVFNKQNILLSIISNIVCYIALYFY